MNLEDQRKRRKVHQFHHKEQHQKKIILLFNKCIISKIIRTVNLFFD